MFPQSGNSSHLTCLSAKRHSLFQSPNHITDAELHKFDPNELLELVNHLKTELGYSNLENAWITSYLVKHNIHLAKATLRKVRFFARNYDSGYVPLNSNEGVSNAVNLPILFNSDSSPRSFASSYISRKTENDSRVANFSISIAFKLYLCEDEIERINQEIKQLSHSTNAKCHKLTVETENLIVDNREASQTLHLFRECLGEVKEHDKREHRRQRNRMRRFMNKHFTKYNRQVQLMDLNNNIMQKEIRALLELVDTRKSIREKMEFAELSQIEVDIRQRTISLSQLDKGVVKIRKQIINTAQEKKIIDKEIDVTQKRIAKIKVSLKKSHELIATYDLDQDKYETEVEEWKNRLATRQSRLKTDYPSTDDYMQYKMQLASLDHEVATLQRVARVTKVNFNQIQLKLTNRLKQADRNKNKNRLALQLLAIM